MNKSPTETIRFRCPHCSVILRSTADQGGKQQRCPRCEQTFKIPQKKSKESPQNTPEPSKPPEPQLIPIVCGVCSTRMYASDAQIGSSIECPDCFTQNLVTPPKKSIKKSQPRMDASMNYDIEPEQEVAVTSEIGQDLLEKADQEIEKEIEEAPKFPEKPFVEGVYTFPFWIQTIPQLIGFPLSWSLAAVLIRFALVLPFMVPVAAIVGVCVLLPTLVTFQKIVENTSIADDESDCRPEGGLFAFIDWAFETVPIAFALFLSVLPVAFVVTTLKLRPEFFALAGITVYLFFPLIYLSMLENASAAGVVSRAVFGSFGKTPGTWLKFYLISAIVLGLVAAAIFGFYFWRTQPQFDVTPPSIGEMFAALLAVTAAAAILLIIYFRLIGRVAMVLSQKIMIEDPDLDAPTSEQSKVEVGV